MKSSYLLLDSVERVFAQNRLYIWLIYKLMRLIGNQPQKKMYNNWHSWDATPWKHPWLTYQNLRDIRQFSDYVLEDLKKKVAQTDTKKLKFGFVGNLANNHYFRMIPLAKAGYKVKLFQDPQDNYIMSQPEWEEFDGYLDHAETNYDRLQELGYIFPKINLIEQEDLYFTADCEKNALLSKSLITKRFKDILLFKHYVPTLKTIMSLRKMDALWGAQHPYYCYLSGKPYVVSQVGSDVWFECSRGDLLGLMQRLTYQNADAFLASNPCSYSHARRLNLTNLIQLPMILDETIYTPGDGQFRNEWQQKSGGDFFVFSTSRVDQQFKGNNIALMGFHEFSKKYSSARLVLMDWGVDKNKVSQLMKELEIDDKIIWLPLSGKARLREYYKSADCFFDQFVLGYYGGAGLEAMASGLPVIARNEKTQYDGCCPTGAPPILHAETPQDVFNHLEALYNNTNYRNKISEETRNWFLANQSASKWLDSYIAVLAAAALKIKPDYAQSPLNSPLTKEEQDYHADQLANAPVFPMYEI